MMRRRTKVRPATVLHYPLTVFSAFVGSVFALLVVSLLILIDLGLRMIASPFAFEADGPIIGEVYQVRIANPPPLDPRLGLRAEPAGVEDRGRAVPLVLEELRTYGPALRHIPLRRVVLRSTLILYGKRAGGLTLDGRGVILLDVRQGGDLRHAIHHEMSHVLDDLFRGDVDRVAQWSRLNPADFSYGGDEVVRALEVLGEDPRGRPDTHGFVSYYAMASPREDRAEIFAAMMLHAEDLRTLAEADPIIRSKCRQLRSELVGRIPDFGKILDRQ